MTTLWRYASPLIPALAILGFFVWFSNWIPQIHWEPPAKHEISPAMAPRELAKIGGVIVRERGCLTCHTIEPAAGVHGQGRGPNLANIAARRATGVVGGPQSAAEYFAQSLYEPGAYVVEDYTDIMPPAHKAPARLSYEEVTAVVDYLQSLGGSPGVKVGDLARPPVAAIVAAGPSLATSAAAAVEEPQAILEKFQCLGCHSLQPDEVLVGPPLDAASLRAVAAERTMAPEAHVMESIIHPGTFVKGDFPADLMPRDYGPQITAAELEAIVNFLLSAETNK